MAKKRNLLLTTLLAAVCLTALLCAALLLPATPPPAQAATVNVTQYKKATAVTDGDYVIVATNPTNGNNYAWTLDNANSSSNSLKSVEIEGDTISSVYGKDAANLEGWQKWSVTVDGGNIYLQSYSTYQYAQGKYFHNNYGWGMTSDSTAKALLLQAQAADGSFELAPFTNGSFVYITGSGAWSYSSSSSYKPAKITFYKATNVPIENAVTVSFASGNDAATGIMGDKVVSSGSSLVLPSCGFTLTNYVFNGWKVGTDEEVKNAGDTITVDGDITLTADWTYNVYDITYVLDQDDPESKTATKYVVKGNSYFIPNFTGVFEEKDLPAGKLFADKWVDADGTEYTKSSSVTLTSNITLYPVYVDALTVSFDWNGGTAPTSTSSSSCYLNKNVLPNSNFTLYKYTSTTNYRPTRTNYILAGWEDAETGEQYLANLTSTSDQTVNVTITKNTVFKAIWKYDGFTITFMVGDEVYATKYYAKSTSAADQKFYFATEGVEMPDAPEGQEFAKWTTASKYNSNYTYTISGSAGASNYSSQYLVLPGETPSGYYKVTNYEVVLTANFQNLPLNVTFKFKTEDGTIYKTENKSISSSSNSASVSLSDTYAGEIPAGYAVLNWTDEDGNTYTKGTYVYIYRTDSVYERTFTVHYAKAVTVTYDANGGTMSSSYSSPIAALENSTYSLPSYASAASRENYELTGFICSADNQFYALKSTYQLGSEDVTFTAVWKYSGYTLTFKVDGQEDVVVLVEIGYDRNWDENTTYQITFDNPTKANADFLGWALNGDTSSLYQKNGTITTAALKNLPNREGVLTAQFKMKEMVTITFHFGAETKEEQAEKGKSYYVRFIDAYFPDWNPEKNAKFRGWAKNSDLSGALTDVSYQTHNADTHYYAVVVRTFNVTFEFGVEDGTVTRQGDTETPVQVLYNSQGNGNPTKENYTLVGWAAEEGGELVYDAAAGVTVSEACTLYAVWDYNYKTITIEIVGSGDKQTVTGEVLKTANQFTLAEVLATLSDEDMAKLGAVEHKTIKWVNVTDDCRPIPGDTDKLTNRNDVAMVLRAAYVDTMYTITIENTGGNDIVITQAYGTPVTAPELTRPGWEFVRFLFNGETYTFTAMPDTNIKVYAQWQALMGTITFDLNGGAGTIASITQQSGSNVDKPADPTKEKYNFVCWTLNGEDVRWDKYDLEDKYYIAMPGGDVTFVAKWEMTAAALAELKETKLAELQAYAAEKEVALPENGIEAATTEQGVYDAFDQGKVDVDAAAARIAAANQALAGLAGKTGLELFNQVKTAETAINALSDEEKEQLDLSALNTAKETLQTLSANASADLETATQIGAAVAAAKIGAIVTAMASLAALAFVTRRRMF